MSTCNRNRIKLAHHRCWKLDVSCKVLSVSRKDNRFIIHTESTGNFTTGMKSKPPGFSTCGRHNKYVEVTIAVRSEGYTFPVMTPNWSKFVRFTDGKGCGCTSGNGNNINISLITEKYFLSIRRN